MPGKLALYVALAGLVSPTLSAEVLLRPRDPAAARDPVGVQHRLAGLLPRLDEPSNTLFLPFFDVDTTTPLGTTTLFAVRNRSAQTRPVTVAYVTTDLAIQRQDSHMVGPRATLAINVRDIPGLQADVDGHARGLALIVTTGVETLAGDFFQIDPGGDFATGDRLVTLADLCQRAETRMLDFGSGTRLRILLDAPQGTDPDVDPPSFTVTPVTEPGVVQAATDVYTDQVLIELSAADFTASPFGSLLFDFTNSSGGWVYAEYSAFARFSAGVNSTCTEPVPP